MKTAKEALKRAFKIILETGNYGSAWLEGLADADLLDLAYDEVIATPGFKRLTNYEGQARHIVATAYYCRFVHLDVTQDDIHPFSHGGYAILQLINFGRGLGVIELSDIITEKRSRRLNTAPG